MVLIDGLELWNALPARLGCVGAAVGKGASRRHMDNGGRLSLDGNQPLPVAALGERGDQRLGIGVRRRLQHLPGGAALQNDTAVHDGDLIRHLGATPMSWVTIMMDMRSLSCSSKNRLRICFWMVTSRAVVGSSASSRQGLQHSAIAMTARWRMPPLISCG